MKIKGTLEIRCMEPNGVKYIKDVFIDPRNHKKLKMPQIEFCVIAALRYSLEVSADNLIRAEELLEEVSQSVVTNIIKAGEHGSFKREK